jgi:hypothetical protein
MTFMAEPKTLYTYIFVAEMAVDGIGYVLHGKRAQGTNILALTYRYLRRRWGSGGSLEKTA